MTLWKRMLLPGLCVSGLLFGHQGGVYGAEQVALKLAYPEGSGGAVQELLLC